MSNDAPRAAMATASTLNQRVWLRAYGLRLTDQGEQRCTPSCDGYGGDAESTR